MSELISGSKDANRDHENALRLDFIRVDQDELDNIRERRKPPKPEPPKKPPPPPKIEVQDQKRPQQNKLISRKSAAGLSLPIYCAATGDIMDYRSRVVLMKCSVT